MARIRFYTDEQDAGAEVRGAFVGAAWMSDYEAQAHAEGSHRRRGRVLTLAKNEVRGASFA